MSIAPFSPQQQMAMQRIGAMPMPHQQESGLFGSIANMFGGAAGLGGIAGAFGVPPQITSIASTVAAPVISGLDWIGGGIASLFRDEPQQPDSQYVAQQQALQATRGVQNLQPREANFEAAMNNAQSILNVIQPNSKALG